MMEFDVLHVILLAHTPENTTYLVNFSMQLNTLCSGPLTVLQSFWHLADIAKSNIFSSCWGSAGSPLSCLSEVVVMMQVTL